MRKVSLVLFGAVIGASAAGMALQPRAFFGSVAEAAGAADTYRQLNLFGDVFERVRADYVEKPDDAKLVESAINGMLSGLDPHSSYMDAKAFKEMRTNTDGEFGGLGIRSRCSRTRSASRARSTTLRPSAPASAPRTSSPSSTASRSTG